jgi:hypothetical protein
MSSDNVPNGYASAWETCSDCGCRFHPAEEDCACEDDGPEAARAAQERAAEEAAEDRKADAEWDRLHR